jgi:hypothetical protein
MRRALLFISIIVLATGCRQIPQMPTYKLARGTPVRAVLLTELTSGGSKEGSEVAMMVSEDVVESDGNVVVPRGAAVMGEVTWSRSEGTLGGLTNRPARLKFKFKHLILPGGKQIPLSADPNDPEAEFELNRANTGEVPGNGNMEQSATIEQNQATLESLRRLLDKGQLDEQDKEQISRLAADWKLDATQKIMDEGRADQVSNLLEQIKGGATVSALAGGSPLIAVDAALELVKVVGKVGSKLSKTLGGRNIHAYVGTPVTAYVRDDLEVTP